MSTFSSTYLTLEFENKLYRIGSIKETKKGELILTVENGNNNLNADLSTPEETNEIREQHLTIHHSRDVNLGVNVITNKLSFIGGEVIDANRIYTEGIEKNLFVPLFLTRGQDFSIDKYLYSKSEDFDYFSLGNYIPTESTIFFMFVVCKSGQGFNGEYLDFNYKNIHYTNYSIVLLWSYSAIPSHSTANRANFTTSQEFRTKLENGRSEIEIVEDYRVLRSKLYLEFLKYLVKIKNIKNPMDYLMMQSFSFMKETEREGFLVYFKRQNKGRN